MSAEYKAHLAFLLIVAAVVLAAGLGLRDPWPADEPRFALIAREMAEGGSWLFPHVGGVIYSDKPPLFIWLVAALYGITGSIRVSFLIPSIFAGLSVLILVTDLGRRLWGPKTGIWCGMTLLALIQFPLQMKSGQRPSSSSATEPSPSPKPWVRSARSAISQNTVMDPSTRQSGIVRAPSLRMRPAIAVQRCQSTQPFRHQ